jgi:hypothetical protein
MAAASAHADRRQVAKSKIEQFLTGLGSLGESGYGLLIVIAFAIVLSLVMLGTDGNLFAGAAFMAGMVVLILTFYKIEWGFYIFIGMVLLFDQFHIPGDEPFTVKVAYFKNLKEIPYIPSFPQGVVNPLELHLLLLIVVWLIRLAARKQHMLNRVPAWLGAIFFFLWLGGSFVSGLSRGGDFLPALWELRALFYLGILYFFVPQVIQTKAQVHAVMWICIVTISYKALQGVIRFIGHGFNFGGYQTLTNHEDPVFMVTMFVFLIAMMLFKVRDKQRKALGWLFLPLFLGFYVALRRATYGSFAISLAGLFLLLPRKEKISMAKAMAIFLSITGIYLAMFWNSYGRLATPAQMIRESISSDKNTQGESYSSNLYREMENFNLSATVQRAPVAGIGFGKKYDTPIPLPSIPFTLMEYIPHNEILWLLVKTGAIGFFFFMLFFNSYLANGSWIFTRLKDPYLRAVCVVCLTAVLNQIVISYYDLQLTYYRNMVYLGLLMGLVPALESMDRIGTPDPGKIQEGTAV